MSVINQGTLYLLATPLGNLGDISLRALTALRECDVIAAEDTRVVSRLLAGLGIKRKKLTSLRQHNERTAAESLARRYADGTLVYLSDAGTPGVSDPGAVLVRILRELGFTITPLPGPCASAAAMSVAGFAAPGFITAGFLPRAAKACATRLTDLASCGLPLVIFEAPGRVTTLLQRISDLFGADTQVCLCREMTKLHEQVCAGTVAELASSMANGKIPARGEFTLALLPPARAALVADARKVAITLTADLPLTKAAKIAAKLTGTNAREIYSYLIQFHAKNKT